MKKIILLFTIILFLGIGNASAQIDRPSIGIRASYGIVGATPKIELGYTKPIQTQRSIIGLHLGVGYGVLKNTYATKDLSTLDLSLTYSSQYIPFFLSFNKSYEWIFGTAHSIGIFKNSRDGVNFYVVSGLQTEIIYYFKAPYNISMDIKPISLGYCPLKPGVYIRIEAGISLRYRIEK